MPKLPVEPFYRVDIRSRFPPDRILIEVASLAWQSALAGDRSGVVRRENRSFKFAATADPDGRDADRNIVIVEE